MRSARVALSCHMLDMLCEENVKPGSWVMQTSSVLSLQGMPSLTVDGLGS